MTISICNPLKNQAYAILAAAVLALAAMPGQATAMSSPFAAMSGLWSGGGVITMANGASFTFELQSNVAHDNGTVSGTWAEMTRHVGGNIDGVARGNQIQVRVSGTLSALLAMRTSANKQSISIEAPGSEMSSVAISLNRSH
jgi:hypothetical protein